MGKDHQVGIDNHIEFQFDQMLNNDNLSQTESQRILKTEEAENFGDQLHKSKAKYGNKLTQRVDNFAGNQIDAPHLKTMNI